MGDDAIRGEAGGKSEGGDAGERMDSKAWELNQRYMMGRSSEAP